MNIRRSFRLIALLVVLVLGIGVLRNELILGGDIGHVVTPPRCKVTYSLGTFLLVNEDNLAKMGLDIFLDIGTQDPGVVRAEVTITKDLQRNMGEVEEKLAAIFQKNLKGLESMVTVRYTGELEIEYDEKKVYVGGIWVKDGFGYVYYNVDRTCAKDLGFLLTDFHPGEKHPKGIIGWELIGNYDDQGEEKRFSFQVSVQTYGKTFNEIKDKFIEELNNKLAEQGLKDKVSVEFVEMGQKDKTCGEKFKKLSEGQKTEEKITPSCTYEDKNRQMQALTYVWITTNKEAIYGAYTLTDPFLVSWPQVQAPREQPEEMALIPAGSFEMGDSFSEGASDERPVHTVTVSAFYMDRYEVSNDEMVEVMQWAYDNGKITVTESTVRNATGDQQELLDLDGSDCRITWSGSAFGLKSEKGSGYPCVEVTWYGAAAFCNYRSEKEGLTPCYDLDDWSCNWSANGYRLPTEAQWEYAARGGVTGHRFPWSDTDTIQHSRANYESNCDYSYDTSPTRGFHPDYDNDPEPYTSPVGSLAPNGYGLYDMAGNVWEWCWDRYDSDYYLSSPGSDPRGPVSGSSRVVRGGGWYSYASHCRVALRPYASPVLSASYLGFRLVRTAP